MALDFPASPSNGQVYFDSTSGSEYIFNTSYSAWIYSSSVSPLSNNQIIYVNQGIYSGSNGLTFNAVSNTVYTNTVNVSQNVSSFYYFGNGAFLTGVVSDFSPAFNKANAALANTSGVYFNGDLMFPSGNVAIRTTTPTASLDVNGSIVIANTLEPLYGYNGIGLLLYNQQTLPINNTTSAQYYVGAMIIPRVGASNTGLTYIIGSENVPVIDSSNQSGRILMSGQEIYAYRSSANDISTFATNGVWGLYIEAGHQSGLNANASTASVYGAQIIPENFRSNVTSMYGVNVNGYSGLVAGANTNTTNIYSFYTNFSVGASSGVGTDTVTNYYDAYLNGVTVAARGTLTNKWGVYQVKTDHNNYFGGAVNFANANVVISGSNVLASFTSANNYAGSMANGAGTIANAAFGSANTAGSYANTAGTNANQAGVVANSVATNTTAAFAYANGVATNTTAAFAYANGVATNTTAAFAKANTAGSSIGNETASASTFYPVFSTTTSGTMTVANVSTSKLTFVPSTGTLSATIFNSLSDIQFKHNVRDIEDSIDILNRIRPVSFNWKETGEKSYGVIAQELETVLPELVVTNDCIKSVAYDPLIAILIDVVQKQQKEIEEIKKLLNTVIVRNKG